MGKSISKNNNEVNNTRMSSTKIYFALKEAILRGVYSSGYRLVEKEIADKFDVSRTPVRSALARLESEGYIEIIPYKGGVVKKISKNEILKMLEVREVLEEKACSIAAENMNDEDRQEIKTYIEQMEKKLKDNSIIEYYTLSSKFHSKILDCTNNQYLQNFTKQINNQITRFHFRNLLKTGRIQESYQEHKKIAEALLKGNSKEAANSMKAHILNVKKTFENDKLSLSEDMFM